jgi:hypothetical protein
MNTSSIGNLSITLVGWLKCAARIWANFSELLEEMPTPETFDVIADWKNP